MAAAAMDAEFRRFAELCPDAILVTDGLGRIEYVNAAFERMTGYSAAELAGHTPAILKSGTHEADFYRSLWKTIRNGNEFRAVFVNRRKGGEIYYEEKIVRALPGPQAGYVSYGRDATERSREFEKLAHAATHDSLTDLPNRSLFLDRLGQALRQATRREEPLTVAIFDIDRFRDTNNRHGHLAGDCVLLSVAERTRACLREADTVARVGGDEFALLLSATGEVQAAPALAKIVAANAAPVCFENATIDCSVSIGASVYPRDGAEGDLLRKRADTAMYAAKAAGGNRWSFYR